MEIKNEVIDLLYILEKSVIYRGVYTTLGKIKMKYCQKCHNEMSEFEREEYKDLCRKCWLSTSQEHYPGGEMTGGDLENLMESE